MENQKYNPKNVQEYVGKTFVTESESEYSITEEGRTAGRRSIEGAKVDLLAGIPEQFFLDAYGYLTEMNKDKLDALIKKEGRKPEKGLRLILSLDQSEIDKTKRVGFMSSIIDKIK